MMVDTHGNQAVLHAFVGEARERLTAVGLKFDALQSRPGNSMLWNAICRDFHAVTRGAAFFDLAELLEVCQPVDTLLDGLRNEKATVAWHLQDVIVDATRAVLVMIEEVAHERQPKVDHALLERLRSAIAEVTGGRVSQ